MTEPREIPVPTQSSHEQEGPTVSADTTVGHAVMRLSDFTAEQEAEKREKTLNLGTNNARRILITLKENKKAQADTTELAKLELALGFNPLEAIESEKKILLTVRRMDEDHRFNLAYYGVDEVISRWNSEAAKSQEFFATSEQE